LRIRIALSLGALVLAGGALTGGIALASEAQPPAPTTATTRPTEPPTVVPTTSRKPTNAPTAMPVPRETTKPAARPDRVRVPVAVPAGPTGDLHLPAIGVTR